MSQKNSVSRITWHECSDANALAAQLSSSLCADVTQVLAQHGTARIGLAGGQTPIAAYAAFAQADLAWPQIHCTLIDERFVAIDDPQSNEGHIGAALAPITARLGSWQGLWQDADDCAEAALLANRAQLHQGLDIAVLGMGSDGHIASLFIDSADYPHAMDRNNPAIVVPIRFAAHAHKIDRLSFTLPALLQAKKILICITGAEKKTVLQASLTDPAAPYAVAEFIKHSTHAIDIFWSPT